MNDVMNEIVMVKVYELDKPLFQKMDFLIDNSIRDCHNKFFHAFDHICEYGLSFTSIDNNELVNFTISDKSMNLFEFNKKINYCSTKRFIFNQINKLTIKILGNLSHVNFHYYLKLQIPIMRCQFFRKLSQIVIIFKLFVMIKTIHFISHVEDGIHIIIHKDVIV